MQVEKPSRTNRERSEATREALLAAARSLFIEMGYADTSTPEIAAAAGITRGALYHHYEDKKALFRAVIGGEAGAVAAAIEAGMPADAPPLAALLAGSEAYLKAMRVPGRTRLLLVEAPAVLGLAEVESIDDATSEAKLREGLEAVMGKGTPNLPILTALLSAAFDRAALAVEAGENPKKVSTTMRFIIERVVGA